MSSEEYRVNGKTTLPALAELTALTGKNLNYAQILDVLFSLKRFCGEYGFFIGQARKFAGLIGWDVKTVRNVHAALVKLPNGGNKALAALPVEDSRLVKFYSEAVANSLAEIDKTAARREAYREKKKAEYAAKNGKTSAPKPVSDDAPAADDAAGTDTPPPVDSADAASAPLTRRKHLENTIEKLEKALASDLEPNDRQLYEIDLAAKKKDLAELDESEEIDADDSASRESREAGNLHESRPVDTREIEEHRKKLNALERAYAENPQDENLAKQMFEERRIIRKLNCVRNPVSSPLAFARPVD